jgi:urease accessory protein
MPNWNPGSRAVLRLPALALALSLAGLATAHAHHVMGGQTPATFVQGLLSGLGHPVIGIDHLAFIVAMGVAVGVAGLSLAIPALFIVASALGVALHVRGIALPNAEFIVAASVLLVGAAVASGRAMRTKSWTPGWASSWTWGWAALFAIAGLFHGYAFGESIFGAEPTPLAAYLAGLVIMQGALATGIALVARRSSAGAVQPRLAGAVIAGIGLAVLAGQLVPA